MRSTLTGWNNLLGKLGFGRTKRGTRRRRSRLGRKLRLDGDGIINEVDEYNWLNNYGTLLTNVWVLGDLDGDRDVDQTDIDLLMANWGMSNATWANGDLNGDGLVNELDLDRMFAQYGLDLDVV